MANLVFGWINFGVMLLVGRYVYLRWFKTQIKTAIIAKKNEFQDLDRELSSLENQVKETAINLELQKQQAALLLANVQHWQDVYLSNQQVENAQIKLLQIQIDTKNQLKLQHLALASVQKKLLTQALEQASIILQDQFNKPTVAKQFLHNICDKLDRDY